MYRHFGFFLGSVMFAASLFAAGLPPLTSDPWDLTYGSTDTFTGFAPAGAVVSFPNPSVMLYGTAAAGGAQRAVELNPFTSADVCYSTTCPSTTTLYPQPNFVFNIGGIVFDPFNIVADTGISSATTNFSFFGDLTFLGSSAAFPSALGTPALYTGEDAGGTSSYLYFVNADGTVTNTLHVTDGAAGSAFLEGVLLDPPASLTFDILGFEDAGPNSSITATTPEPGSLGMVFAAGLFLVWRTWKLPRQAKRTW